jgi:hypothetical protein
MSTSVISKVVEVPTVYDLGDPDRLPVLKDSDAMAIELSSTYWSPDKDGDQFRGFYQGIEPATYEDRKTGEVIDLPCALFLTQLDGGDVATIRNGSKRLVAALEDAVDRGRIGIGSPILVTFRGKKRNKRNEYSSDTWSIKPLVVKEK